MCLLAIAPASTKVAGAAWLTWVLLGGWAVWRWPVVGSTAPADVALERAAKVFVLGCAAALAFRAVGVLYWNDPWGERHFDVRMLLGAMATYGLVRRMRVSDRQLLGLGLALNVAGFCAFVITLLYGRETPSNPIPWAAAMAFMACLLLPRYLLANKQPVGIKWVYGLGLTALLLGVLLSESRGAFPVFLLVGLAVLVHALFATPGSFQWHAPVKVLAIGSMALLAVTLAMPQLWSASYQRLVLAWQEGTPLILPASSAPAAEAINTSVGARLYMWQRTVQVIDSDHLLGYGRDTRVDLIHGWGQESGSALVTSLGHVHNEVLNAVLDHGLFGLASVLCTWLTLLAAAWLCRKVHWSLSLAMLGMALMHALAGLTNVNTAHNYYGVMLSTLWGLSFFSQSKINRVV